MDTARKDFERIQKCKFMAAVSIESDDDFDLDIDHNFQIYSDSKSELRSMLIQKLAGAKLDRVCSWSIETATEKRSGDHSDSWFSIRDHAIKKLKAKSLFIHYGGNQTICINICENM